MFCNAILETCLEISVTWWPEDLLNFGHLQQWKIPKLYNNLPWWVQNFVKFQLKIQYFCQRLWKLAKVTKFRQIRSRCWKCFDWIISLAKVSVYDNEICSFLSTQSTVFDAFQTPLRGFFSKKSVAKGTGKILNQLFRNDVT